LHFANINFRERAILKIFVNVSLYESMVLENFASINFHESLKVNPENFQEWNSFKNRILLLSKLDLNKPILTRF